MKRQWKVHMYQSAGFVLVFTCSCDEYSDELSELSQCYAQHWFMAWLLLFVQHPFK